MDILQKVDPLSLVLSGFVNAIYRQKKPIWLVQFELSLQNHFTQEPAVGHFPEHPAQVWRNYAGLSMLSFCRTMRSNQIVCRQLRTKCRLTTNTPRRGRASFAAAFLAAFLVLPLPEARYASSNFATASHIGVDCASSPRMSLKTHSTDILSFCTC